MLLTPKDVDKLLLSVAAMVARDRMARGVKLNYPEAVALLSSFVMEGARDGRTVAELTRSGRTVLSRDDEHLDMLMVCHHLNPAIPEDLAFAESRIRPSTIAAEDWLHDMGAISIIGSDSQAMGRVGEVITRTFQTAHVMKDRRCALAGEPVAGADNLRAQRYAAKVTINPAIAHGLDDEVGSVEVGKLADLCLWNPAFFGIGPAVVLKGGLIAWA